MIISIVIRGNRNHRANHLDFNQFEQQSLNDHTYTQTNRHKKRKEKELCERKKEKEEKTRKWIQNQ